MYAGISNSVHKCHRQTRAMVGFLLVQLSDAVCFQLCLLDEHAAGASAKFSIGCCLQWKATGGWQVACVAVFALQACISNFCKGSRFSSSLLLAFLYSFASCKISGIHCPCQEQLCWPKMFVASRVWTSSMKRKMLWLWPAIFAEKSCKEAFTFSSFLC